LTKTHNSVTTVSSKQITPSITHNLTKDQTVFLEYTLAKLKNTLKSGVEQRVLAGFDMEKMQVKMRLRREIIGKYQTTAYLRVAYL
jgi:predicted ABC-type ATPase